jgi:hypothetical protein
MTAEAELLDGRRRLHRGHRDRLQQVGLDRLVDRFEDGGLAVEVVVERAAGHAGARRDLLAARARVPLLGKQVARGAEQRRPGPLRPLGLGPVTDVTRVTVDGEPPSAQRCVLPA